MERADIWNELVCEPSEERDVPVAATLKTGRRVALDCIEYDGYAIVKT